MRAFTLTVVILGLVLAAPALAVDRDPADESPGRLPERAGSNRTNDCPGGVVWDTGMYDEFWPISGCCANAQCFVQAENPDGMPADGHRTGDDFEVSAPTYITHVKVWGRYNTTGYNSSHRVHGFCIQFYRQDYLSNVCPDGSVDGEEAIGERVYDHYASIFTEYETSGSPPRSFNYCITLPQPFMAEPGFVYYVSTSADYDRVSDGTTYTRWYINLYMGVFDPYCEVSWWDIWSDPPVNWNAISVGLNIPYWSGWNAAFVLYASPLGEGGACCRPDGSCTMTTQADCPPPSVWHPDWTCEPQNPCTPVPVREANWGWIKRRFR